VLITGGGAERISASVGILGGGVGGVAVLIVERVRGEVALVVYGCVYFIE